MNIQEMKEAIIATNAFNNVSFNPEIRIERFANDFENTIFEISNKCNNYGIPSERFIEKCFKLAMDYLHAESRCVSWAIAGPANFPVARNEKRVNSSMDKLNRYVEFCENIEKTLKRITRKSETEDDKKNKWLERIEVLKNRQEMMKDVNSMIRKGLIKEAEEKYNITLKPNYWGNVGFESYQLRNNLATIKRLEEQVKQIDLVRENKAETGFKFNGGSVEFDCDEIRYNIFFDKRPEPEMRAKLKLHGFKWSPCRGAWTRGAKTIRIDTIKNILKGE